MTALYNFALFLLLLVSLPKLLFDYVIKKKYRKSFLARLFPQCPTPHKKPLIWLHSVSMGETKALSTLVPHIRKTHPNAFIYVTTGTETGQEEAKKRIKEADGIGYLPFDFSWIMKKMVRKLQPALLILIEGDFWLNLIKETKKRGGKVFLANGKLSEKSLKRHLAAPFFSRPLFSAIDHFFLQSDLYQQRFLKLGVPPEKLTVTGNLKFDIPPPPLADLPRLQKKYRLAENDRIITLGSTHEGEESLLIQVLLPLLDEDPHLKILVVPRHPERFASVKEKICHPQIRVVDEMGILPACYKLSYLAIVGGSFVTHVGGHDIFEPVKLGVPTLYGPYMYGQVDLDKKLTASGAGKKVTKETLPQEIRSFLRDPSLHQSMAQKGKELAQTVMGASLRTWNHISLADN
ncbi:MAG: hypothetical protein KDK63_03530 [Chlamydiia bacterium]|nr:hypothetical protein [Chlamydiia bacterium]